MGLGGYATHRLLPAGAVVPLPEAVSFEVAATAVDSYTTMLFALTRRTSVRPGEWVVVLGAGGGIGLAAVDVASSLGARVIAAASSPAKRGHSGRYLVVGFAGGSIPRVPLNRILLGNRTVIGVDWGAWAGQDPAGNRALVAELLQRVAAGVLHPVAPQTYPLERAAEALAELGGRRVTGKLALLPGNVH